MLHVPAIFALELDAGESLILPEQGGTQRISASTKN